MNDDVLAVAELARAAARARLRILRIEGHESPDGSWQRVTCHVHREDVSWAAVPLIYTIAALSFADARPRALSEADYQESDEWLIADTFGADTTAARDARVRFRLHPRAHDENASDPGVRWKVRH